MTCDEILKMIHRNYEGGTDYPQEGSEDYVLRMGLINDGIMIWGEQESVRWKELFDDEENYTEPVLMTSGSNTPQMSKPLFLVYYVLARLYEIDGRNDLVSFYEQKALDVLGEMFVLNEIPDEETKTSLTQKDLDYQLDSFVFGE